MAVQFFFKDPKEDNMGEILSSGLKAGQEFRQASIKRDLDAAYNQHVVTAPQYDAAGNVIARPGDLNASGFIKSAQEAGLPMEESMKYLAHQKALRDAQLDTATTESMIRSAGYDPSPVVTGRAGAPIGNPATTQEQAYLKTADNPDKSSLEDWFAGIQKPAAAQAPVAPTAEEIAANDRLVNGLRNPSEVGPKTPAQGGVSYADVAKTLGIGGAPQVSADGSQMDLGSGVIQGPVEKPVEEAKMSAPEAWNSYVPQPLQKDTRTAGQAVQDTYQEPKSEGVGVGVDQAEANGEFAWSPVDDNSSAFRKYKTTLDSRLKGAGMVDAEGNASPSMLLKKLYTATYNQNLSAKPDQRLIALGAEGRKKYLEMDAEYKASQIKAAGLASKAVLDARQKLSEEANTYGVQTIAGKTEARTAEKHEADMGGRRAGGEDGSVIIRLRTTGVSEAEKTRGELIGNAYLDLKEAKGIGGFEGAYGMALARAKADGNVNRDVILGHLIAMGAVPSNKAMFVKSMMDSNGNLTGDIYNQAKGALGSLASDPAKETAWYNGAVKNMKDAMKLVGYGILEKPAKDRTAKDDLEDALGKGKSKKPEPKKDRTTAKLGSITNPYPAGSTPPVGSYYVHSRTGKVMKRVR